MVRMRPRVGWAGVAFAGLSLAMLVLWGTGMVMYLLPVSELMEMSDMQIVIRRSTGVMHGVVTWVVCVLCGRGVWPHVQLMFQHRGDRRQWTWGLVNLAVLTILLVSGLVLLYGSADWHEGTSLGHFWVGALAPLAYVVHGWNRLSRRR